jgi:hypothetical protein
MNERDEQLELCRAEGVEPNPPSRDEKVGVALATLNLRPLNGLRHPPKNGTCGWYLWGGERLLADAAFFQPVHVAHLQEICPETVRFLALPPCWRFLLSEDQVDVWSDASCLMSRLD